MKVVLVLDKTHSSLFFIKVETSLEFLEMTVWLEVLSCGFPSGPEPPHGAATDLRGCWFHASFRSVITAGLSVLDFYKPASSAFSLSRYCRETIFLKSRFNLLNNLNIFNSDDIYTSQVKHFKNTLFGILQGIFKKC